MRSIGGLSRDEYLFGVLIASVHAGQHVLFRLFPPLIPILVVDLDSPLWQLGLLVSVSMFAGGIFQAPMGILSDRLDRLYLLAPAFVAMSFGYLIFVLAPGIGPMIPEISVGGHVFDGAYQIMALGMFVVGIGYSAIHPVGYPLISANVATENKGKVLGMWGSASKVGDAVAPFLIGAFIVVLPWEWILVGVSLFGFAYAFGLVFAFKSGPYETRPPETDDDRSSSSSQTAETDRRQFWFPMAAVVLSFFFILFAGNGLITYAPVFVSDVYGFSVSMAGYTFEPASVANFYFGVLLMSGAISQLVLGGLADAYDYRAVLISLLGVSAVALVVLATIDLTPVLLLVVFVVIGATQFGLNPARDALISEITPAEYEGRTFGYIWTLALVGSSIYPVVVGYVADTSGLRASFATLAIGAVGGLVCIALLYSPRVYQERTPAKRRS
ncbi:MFS transporter [Natrarchaeobius halalkaliphilus]|uniref:MFS transporter n=1 Tax=Natrarchaeobius halalkaliphilus TaxID=1679091 RepID=A0A3N6LKL2_9EURY|nr:MFS transporter [Natrarchaeobius halalkaliphilus]RQG86988.1 MFS transporter [Natrarchaeobius halalkaliphilus]